MPRVLINRKVFVLDSSPDRESVKVIFCPENNTSAVVRGGAGGACPPPPPPNNYGEMEKKKVLINKFPV